MKSVNDLLYVVAAVAVLITKIDGMSSWPDYFTKDCCKAHDSVALGFICDDGKYAPFTGCCGVGSCNTRCCQCAGGCKTGKFGHGAAPVGRQHNFDIEGTVTTEHTYRVNTLVYV